MLTELRPDDAETLVRYLNDQQIHNHTLRIPLPYDLQHAEEFLNFVKRAKQNHHHDPVHFAIRHQSEGLIGCCGVDEVADDAPQHRAHRGEIGYWLGRPYWGRGIMTAVVAELCRHAFLDWGLKRLVAEVFVGNQASCRVLQKCGFRREGLLQEHIFKNGRLMDVQVYGLLRRRWEETLHE